MAEKSIELLGRISTRKATKGIATNRRKSNVGKNKKINETETEVVATVVAEDTPAQASLHPNFSQSDDPKAFDRHDLITKIVGSMHMATDHELENWFYKMIEGSKDQTSGAVYGDAESNMNSVKPHDGVKGLWGDKSSPKDFRPGSSLKVKTEDVVALFDGETLSEEFKTKTTTLFEAAVAGQVMLKEAEMTEAYSVALAEAIEDFDTTIQETVEEIQEQLASYANYIAEEFMKENAENIQSNLRTELTENFIKGLKDLFTEHYIDIPEDKVDVVEELMEKVSELEDRCNTLINEKTVFENKITQNKIDEAISEVAKGLADTEVSKLKVLSESVTFKDSEDYKNKINLIKEAHFNKKATDKVEVILEDDFSQGEELLAESMKVASPGVFVPGMDRFVAGISKMSRK